MLKRFFQTNPEENRQVVILRKYYACFFLFWILVFFLVKTANPLDWPLPRKIVFFVFVILLLTWMNIPIMWRWLGTSIGVNFTLVISAISIGLVLVQLFMMTSFSRQHVLGAWPSYGVVPILQFDLNNIGMRDVDHTYDKPANFYRILLLGDSFATGQGVSAEAYFPQRLREISPDHVEIIIVATQGWSTHDQLIAYQTIGKCYSPDMVVVGAVTNDLEPPRQDTLEIYLGQSSDPSLDESQVAVEQVRSQKQWRLFTQILPIDVSYLLDYAMNQIAGQLNLRQDYAEYEANLYRGNEEQDTIDQIELWEISVTTLQESIVSGGALPVAFVLPSPRNYNDIPTHDMTSNQHNLLSEGFESAGFETTDLFPAYLEAFGAVPYRQLWALPNDGHPGEEIHAWYAEEMWHVINPYINQEADLPFVESPCSE